MTGGNKKLIEVAVSLEAINIASVLERSALIGQFAPVVSA